MTKLHALTALPLLALIVGSADIAHAGDLSVPVEVLRQQERIRVHEDAGDAINAIIVAAPDVEAQTAKAAASGLPLAGRTVLVKDNVETRDFPTTAGSLALIANDTKRDSPLVARLRAAGAVISGKANLSEWANIRSSGSTSGWSAVGGLTRNPHAPTRNSCGSSSGSGAAVAAMFAWAAIGTETDGSITCPASVNGVVGLKPTVGLVSRTHIVPISSSQDTAGPMAQTVYAAAQILTSIAGSDPADPATMAADERRGDYTSGLATASLKGVRIGVMRKQVGEREDVSALFDAALADMKATGAELVEIQWEADSRMYEAEWTVLLYELRESMDAYLAGSPAQIPVRSLADVIRFNEAHAAEEMRWFGQEIFVEAQGTVDADAYALAKADAYRLARTEGIEKLLADNDVAVLIAPTTGPAWSTDLVYGDHYPGGIGIGSIAAIGGTPHLTVPMGTVKDLPVGLSFMGPAWADHDVLKIGAAYERARTAKLAVAPVARVAIVSE
ncbi:amidase [Croceicoccus ponticola]|uniref:Amidase n=1 Tax=Croceicoccus ponticola TaxID=2217664 RepID=A0A437GYF0_9SPHN|nr:amidase [Croceicoccus ponticola]RVQ66506.1 amidase [Croceicoccus ponticola]